MIWGSISVADPHIPKSNRQKTLFKLREKLDTLQQHKSRDTLQQQKSRGT